MKLSRDFTMKLAKLMIAASWSDGELSLEEINALKDLIFSSVELTEDEWAELDIYMETRIMPDEVNALLKNVVAGVHTRKEKDFVLSMIQKVVESDGKVTPEEKDLLNKVRESLEQKGPAIKGLLSDMIKSTIGRRKKEVEKSLHREEKIDEYIKNKVYVKLLLEKEQRRIARSFPDDDMLKKLCLGSGLMATIAWIDLEITEDEKDAITAALETYWKLSPEQASLVTELSCSSAMKGLDIFRLSRSFYDMTTRDEKKNFLTTLFAVAYAEKKDSSKEIEKIRTIANFLKLTHSEFIDAKMTVLDGKKE